MGYHKMLRAAMFPVVLLLVAAVILLTERIGLGYSARNSSTTYLPQSVIDNKPDGGNLPADVLMLTDSSVSYSTEFSKQMQFILNSISIGYNLVDVRKSAIPDYNQYSTVILVIPDFAVLGNKLQMLFDWINGGGKLFLLCPIEPTAAVRTIIYQIGVLEMGNEYNAFSGLKMKTDFMIGSKGYSFHWSDDNGLSAVALRLSPETIVHVVSDTNIPLLWEKKCGKGRVVVNHLSLSGKESRGYYTAAFSLLYDAFAYPVINSNIFFIDDFPAPVSGGYNKYIQEFYQRDNESFFTNIWWPDMMSLSKRYGLKYTGMLIESYEDKLSGTFPRNSSISRFTYFGNMLLQMGGEIGLHGYNHQPLCFTGFDYKGKVNYNTWNSYQDAKNAFDELISFGNSLFKKNNFSVYVAPSNILSEEGEKLILDNYPQIRTISGIYIKEDYEYEQEFGVSENGIVNLPRIVAGSDLDSYDKWHVFNELNFHYINSHFIHPDDVLDPDRGAYKGWSVLYSQLESNIKWLADIAPDLRDMTASDAAKAVERYDTIGVKRSLENDVLTLDIQNFYDSACFIVRIRDGSPGTVTGGSMEQLNSELYVLTANSAKVEIKIVR